MILRAALIIILLLTVGVGFASAQVVSIPDLNVRAEVEAALGKAPGAPITIADMVNLTHFDFGLDANISNLTGLEHAINLTGQGLVIDDISHISGNLNIEWLFLWGNNISRVNGLSNLNSLEWLFLGDNNISGSFSLWDLDTLRGLHLGTNNISGLSNAERARSLEWLFLGDQQYIGELLIVGLGYPERASSWDQQYIGSLKCREGAEPRMVVPWRPTIYRGASHYGTWIP